MSLFFYLFEDKDINKNEKKNNKTKIKFVVLDIKCIFASVVKDIDNNPNHYYCKLKNIDYGQKSRYWFNRVSRNGREPGFEYGKQRLCCCCL